MRNIRCAVYTRKSSDEGLDQTFNSLDAQREACAAYILSQASEGWINVGEHYDDGGISGGTLARPALRRLLAEVSAGNIDIVVVYKVDRLTRSLLDFAKLVEKFDSAKTSFVSITQSFNTTSSMGRLTLNMLLSFAQFEREVTAERIRDKIAASKAKGMWMGGYPPLGYRTDGRTLAIDEEHATLARYIFERYLALGTVSLLAEALKRERVFVPQRTMSTGKVIGGTAFSRGQLYVMLKCRTYLGEICHRDKVYPGLHPPIIEHDLWNAVQAQLAQHVRGERSKGLAQASLFAGKVVDAVGEPLIMTHASVKAGAVRKRYRYYVSRALHHGGAVEGMRLPAGEFEKAVAERLARAFDDPLDLIDVAGLNISPAQVTTLHWRGKEIAAAIRQQRPEVLSPLVDCVRVAESRITVCTSTEAVALMIGAEHSKRHNRTIELVSNVTKKRFGRAMRLIQDDTDVPTMSSNSSLIRAIAQAHGWWSELRLGKMRVMDLAAQHGITASYMTRVLRLAYLSPRVVDGILNNRQSSKINVDMLTRRHKLSASWHTQEQSLLCR